MSSLVEKLAPALIALIGTLLVALIGFYQWRRQQQRAKQADYISNRRKAYEELWNKLEAINLELRDDRMKNPTLYSQLKEANTFFLQHSLYLDEQEQKTINDYIEALHRVRSLLYTSGDEDAVLVWHRTNAYFDPERAKAFDEKVRSAYNQVEEVRTAIRTKVLNVVKKL
jgi:hypothetical protein